jgi:hypothetical protein
MVYHFFVVGGIDFLDVLDVGYGRYCGYFFIVVLGGVFDPL